MPHETGHLTALGANRMRLAGGAMLSPTHLEDIQVIIPPNIVDLGVVSRLGSEPRTH